MPSPTLISPDLPGRKHDRGTIPVILGLLLVFLLWALMVKYYPYRNFFIRLLPVRKLVHIVCVYVLSMLALFCLVHFHPVDADNYAKDSYPWVLADFHERLQLYLQSPKDRVQTVLVGPSYAVALGEFASVFNLGFVGSTQSEIAAIVSNYCRKTDRVLYAVTIWDFMIDSSLVGREAMHDSYRRLFLLRERIRPEKSGPMVLDVYWSKMEVSDSEFAMVAEALAENGVAHDPATLMLLIKRIKHYGPKIHRNFGAKWEPDLSPYHALHKEFPNIIFIMFPSIPLAPIESADSMLAHTINAALAAKTKLKMASEQSGLPYVDCSQPELLDDLFHSNDQGKSILRGKIAQINTLIPLREMAPL